MNAKNIKSLIVYLSPAGTTRHVSQVIDKKLKELGCEAELYNLGNREDIAKLNGEVKDGLKDCCLWVRTPVYTGHADSSDLRTLFPGCLIAKENFAVPFVTNWGL